jgi:hypothetical protein
VTRRELLVMASVRPFARLGPRRSAVAAAPMCGAFPAPVALLPPHPAEWPTFPDEPLPTATEVRTVNTSAAFEAAIAPVANGGIAEGGHVLLADGLFIGSVTISQRIVVRAANRLAAGFDGDVTLGVAADGAIVAGCLFRADSTRSAPRITLNGDDQRATRNKLESSPGRVAVIHVGREDAPQLNYRIDRNEIAGYDHDAIRITNNRNADPGKTGSVDHNYIHGYTGASGGGQAIFLSTSTTRNFSHFGNSGYNRIEDHVHPSNDTVSGIEIKSSRTLSIGDTLINCNRFKLRHGSDCRVVAGWFQDVTILVRGSRHMVLGVCSTGSPPGGVSAQLWGGNFDRDEWLEHHALLPDKKVLGVNPRDRARDNLLAGNDFVGWVEFGTHEKAEETTTPQGAAPMPARDNRVVAHTYRGSGAGWRDAPGEGGTAWSVGNTYDAGAGMPPGIPALPTARAVTPAEVGPEAP